MPDGRELLAAGLRAERAGGLDHALRDYRAALDSSTDPAIRAEALTRIADVHRERCEWDDGLAAARAAQTVAHEAGLPRELAEARIAEGNVLMIKGEFADAMPIFQTVAQAETDARIRGIALQNMGSMQAQLGQFGAAEGSFQESHAQFEKAGYQRGQVIALNNLARLAIDRSAFDVAGPLLERAMRDVASIQDAELDALVRQNLATVLMNTSEPRRAEELAKQALDYFRSCGNHYRTIECLRLIAGIRQGAGDVAAARRCYEQALELAERIESDVEIRVLRFRLAQLNRAE